MIGSVEYTASVLKSSVLVVLGHDGCGAVKAAIDVVTKGTSLPGELPAVVQPIIPTVEAVEAVETGCRSISCSTRRSKRTFILR